MARHGSIPGQNAWYSLYGPCGSLVGFIRFHTHCGCCRRLPEIWLLKRGKSAPTTRKNMNCRNVINLYKNLFFYAFFGSVTPATSIPDRFSCVWLICMQQIYLIMFLFRIQLNFKLNCWTQTKLKDSNFKVSN